MRGSERVEREGGGMGEWRGLMGRRRTKESEIMVFRPAAIFAVDRGTLLVLLLDVYLEAVVWCSFRLCSSPFYSVLLLNPCYP